MGNFVAICATPELVAAESLYRRAVVAGTAAAGREPNSTVREGSCLAASFPRQNDSKCAIAHDAASASWLGVVGTCFHSSGKNDPENLLRHYLSQGADELANSLEGFFAIIIADGRTKELTVVTDVIGSCHFYARKIEGCVALSSSSLLLASLGYRALDPVGCQEFLGMGILYEDRTLYRDVKKLPPASIVRFRDGVEVERRRYWDLESLAPESLTAEAATDALWQELTAAAAKVGNQFGEIVCDLTGGYDSRSMAAAFLGAGQKFTAVVSGREESADVVISRGLARMLGLEHKRYSREEDFSFGDLARALRLSDGEYDIVEYAGIAATHRKLSETAEISINGSFGEVARGYWWELLFPHTGARRPLDSQKLSVRRYAWRSSDDLFQPQFHMNLAEHMAGVIERATQDLHGFPNTFLMDAAYLRMRMQRWQGRIASSTNRIWPCLSPFMFRSVLEVMLRAPFAVRRRSLLVRRMLARYQPALANYPLEHGYPAAPASWTNLPRFLPLVSYYGGRVAEKIRSRLAASEKSGTTGARGPGLWRSEEVAELLNPPSMFTMEVLERPAVTALLQSAQRGDPSRAAEVNRILTLEMALREAR